MDKLEELVRKGYSPALIYDDEDNRWACSLNSLIKFNDVKEDEARVIVFRKEWKPTIKEAIDCALAFVKDMEDNPSSHIKLDQMALEKLISGSKGP
jgi:hypothetical protein